MEMKINGVALKDFGLWTWPDEDAVEAGMLRIVLVEPSANLPQVGPYRITGAGDNSTREFDGFVVEMAEDSIYKVAVDSEIRRY